jgi:hypothetical protein
MGWTYFRSNEKDKAAVLKKEFEHTNALGSLRWVAHSKRGSVIYAVLERRWNPGIDWKPDDMLVNDQDGAYRFICVFLTSNRRHDLYNFGYKDITECMGPCEKDCPARLIKLASPFRETYQGYARAWRQACLERGKTRREAKAAAPKPGQRFETKRPVHFRDAGELRVFECVEVERRGRKCRLYRSPDYYGLLRFNPARYGFTILP